MSGLTLPRRTLACLTLAGLALAARPGGARAQAADSTAAPPDAPRRPLPLFATDSVLRLTLATDLRALAGERDTLRPRPHPGTLGVAGGPSLPVTVSTRGHFRLRRDVCPFPPLRLQVGDAGRGETPFRGQRALKLVTHCRNAADAEQIVLREYLAYRAAALVLPVSFRARLARVRYAERGDSAALAAAGAAPDRFPERWAMLVESERELARRTGGAVLEHRGGSAGSVADDGVPFALFAYFLGNTDWSIAALHNVRLLRLPTFEVMAVPYDFDFSGLVRAPYATPDPRLLLRSVQDRLWRGTPCVTPAQVDAALAPYRARRAELEALWRTTGPALSLDRRYAAEAADYVAAFYRETRDPAAFVRGLGVSCPRGEGRR